MTAMSRSTLQRQLSANFVEELAPVGALIVLRDRARVDLSPVSRRSVVAAEAVGAFGGSGRWLRGGIRRVRRSDLAIEDGSAPGSVSDGRTTSQPSCAVCRRSRIPWFERLRAPHRGLAHRSIKAPCVQAPSGSSVLSVRRHRNRPFWPGSAASHPHLVSSPWVS